MANESVSVSVAANRDVPASSPACFQDCRDVIHIAVFFDGTGNHKDADTPNSKWSNVARLFQSALACAQLDRGSRTIYPIYISGVGTPYNGKAVNWLSKAGVWLQDGFLGMGVGTGGDRRLEQGDDTVNDRLRDVLIANARTLGGTVQKYAEANSAKSFADVNAVLGKHRLIKIINLSIFGFSRGAALARAFSNRVIAKCEVNGDELCYGGYPIRLNFMGVFDTVASFGVPSQNIRTPFGERDLIVSPKIERCVHYVAAHEVRFSFPVDLIRKNGKLAGEWVEKVYPGVHSDVGGGYEPLSQGIDNNYARIPMRDMMAEAKVGGVRMLAYDDVRTTFNVMFTERFECKVQTETAYAAYMAACGATSGTIENQMKQHLKTFYSACGTMHRKGMQTPGERRRNEDKYKYLGPKGMAWEISKYRAAAKAGGWVRFGDLDANAYAQYVKPEEWQIEAWDASAPDGAVEFVAKYVHDSKVDFLANLAEPFSYFKARGVEESSNSIWHEAGNWIRSKTRPTVEAAGSAIHTGKVEIAKAANATAKAAQDAADAAQRRSVEAAEYATQKFNEATDAANRAYGAARQATHDVYDASEKIAVEGYEATARAAADVADAAQQRAAEAASYAERKAREAADAVGKAYQAGERRGKDLLDSSKRKTAELEDDVESMFDRGSKWVMRTAADAGRAADRDPVN